MTRLVVVGAGPKAAAIAARATVLRDLGIAAPAVEIIEVEELGANWRGSNGYSDGRQPLCNPGEKDIGYPYELGLDGKGVVAEALYSRFSWGRYLIERERYGEWVDRGRQFPDHDEWADYIAWVIGNSNAVVREGRVAGLRRQKGRWLVDWTEDGRGRVATADGVVLTGPGAVKATVEDLPCDPRVRTSADFWLDFARFEHNFEDPLTVCVVGGGGTAGAVIAHLIRRFAHKQIKIVVVNGTGTLFPRSDGFLERRFFTDPSEWRDLPIKQREEIMARTEFAVVSDQNKAVIDRYEHLTPLAGRVEGAEVVTENGDELYVTYTPSGSSQARRIPCDELVLATGFDPWTGLRSLLRRTAYDRIRRHARYSDMPIGRDLAFSPDILSERLHVPALAGMDQGPGFPNLGCLGLLAKRIVDPYIEAA